MSSHSPSIRSLLPDAPGTLTISQAEHEGWTIASKHIGLLASASMLVLILCGGVGVYISGLFPHVGLIIFTLLVSGPILAGFFMLGVRLVRGERAGLEIIFQPYKRFDAILIVTAVQHLPTFILSFLWPILDQHLRAAATPKSLLNPLGMSVCGAISVCIIWLCYFLRFCLAPIFVLDERAGNLSPLDAIKTSWRFTGKRFVALFIATIIISSFASLSIVLVGIGLLVMGIPWAVCTVGALYRQLVGGMNDSFCPACGYNLTGIANPRCPEYGQLRHIRTVTAPY